MKDYYQILGVSRNSTDDEVRTKYRKLAMQFHPDRNPDDPQAEERFKEVAEAYGVLTDPVKRREYNACRARGGTYTGGDSAGGFSYSQEDILKDLFNDPRFQQMFTGLLREFQRSGFRHSSHFVKRSFFGGKGGILVGGIFFLGSLAGPLISGAAKKKLPESGSVIRSIGSKFSSLLGGAKSKSQTASKNSKPASHIKDYDITYHTPLSLIELQHGKNIQILVYGEQGEQTLKVKIPPGSKNGQKLRLQGKGRPGPLGRGDLYLKLEQKH
jgi:DnaJ-class molecular chaperone